MGKLLNIHDFSLSTANGPGRRAVIWFQGCSFRCKGCFNPGALTMDIHKEISVDDLFNEVRSLEMKGEIEGITLSGGEPLMQIDLVLQFLERVRNETSLSVIVFTGWTLEEIAKMEDVPEALEKLVDVIIAGRYVERWRIASGLIGSSNKKMYFFTQRYREYDFREVPVSEIRISLNGDTLVTGINPAKL